MSRPINRQTDIADVISDMEGGIRDVARWADVFVMMAGSSYACQPETIHVIAAALRTVGQELETKFERAFNLTHPLSDSA